MRCFRLLLIPLLLAGHLRAAESVVENAPETSSVERNLASLRSVIEPLRGASTELEKLRRELSQAATPEAQHEIQVRIDAENQRVRQLRGNFQDILGGAEAAEYDGIVTPDTTLQKQLSELLQPILGTLRDATSTPRELEALRDSLETWTERKRKSDIVVNRIDEVIARNTDTSLAPELEAARRLWTGRAAQAAGQISVLGAQIADRELQQKPIWETLSRVFGDFFRSRGLNLLIALLVAVAGFMVVRRIYGSVRRYTPAHRHGKGSLTSRISDVLSFALAGLVAVIGVILVFYVRGDWLLLTLVVVMLIGAAWAGKAALPPYVEQIRMILNLGSVREDERIIHRGLPWRVASIGFFTTVTNPSLQGGVLRIPIRDLMEMTSREPDPKEPWFPTEKDDWVVLADGTYGKTVTQTPEQVVVLKLGGSLKTYPTAGFLEQSPENLSHGFRVSCTFGIDCRHQPDAAESIPAHIAGMLTSTLVGDHGREGVRSVIVEFCEAVASSLNYRILADFDGSLGSRYQALHRQIQQVCLECCIANGWGVPITHVTVHQLEIPARQPAS